MNRRTFIQKTVTAAAACVASSPLLNLLAADPTQWPIGCFNRAWTKWSYDDALDGVKAAGYKITGLLTGQRGEPFTSSAATPAYLDALKKRIHDRGLEVNMTTIHFRPGG